MYSFFEAHNAKIRIPTWRHSININIVQKVVAPPLCFEHLGRQFVDGLVKKRVNIDIQSIEDFGIILNLENISESEHLKLTLLLINIHALSVGLAALFFSVLISSFVAVKDQTLLKSKAPN